LSSQPPLPSHPRRCARGGGAWGFASLWAEWPPSAGVFSRSRDYDGPTPASKRRGPWPCCGRLRLRVRTTLLLYSEAGCGGREAMAPHARATATADIAAGAASARDISIVAAVPDSVAKLLSATRCALRGS